MKLIKLTLNNFRQFYGFQSIEFSTDDDKSVTLIHGENNGGKTALLNAIRWCLYEELTDNLLDPQRLLNKQALQEGKNTYSVKLQLVHENSIFEIQRIGHHGASSSTLKVFKIEDGCYSSQPEKYPNTLINSFLPKEMSHYFFYQGEGTGTLNSQNDFSHIKSAISKVLGLTIAEKTLVHLRKVKTSYQSDLREYDTANEIERLIEEKELTEENLNSEAITLSAKEEELAQANREYDECIVKLDRLDRTSIENELKRRDIEQARLSSLRREYSQLKESKAKNISTWLYRSYSSRLSTVDLSGIDTTELKQTHRYNVDRNLIESILSNHECICGTSIKQDSSAEKLIRELAASAVDMKLKHRWEKANLLLEQLKHIESPKKEMLQILSDIDNREEAIKETLRTLEEFNHTISESNIDGVRLLEKSKREIEARRSQLNHDIPILVQRINQYKHDLKDIDTRISKLASSQPRALKIKNLIAATDKIIEVYEEAISASKNGVENILLRKMNDFFQKVSYQGYTVKKSSNNTDESFTWVIVDRLGKRVAVGNGYQAMLAISFVISLIQFSKDRSNSRQHLLTPGTVAPFIADSILAFVSSDNGRELVKYIAESVEQSVFLFSQAQWTESHSDKGIRDKVGKEYNLVQHTPLSEKEFNGAYPTRLQVQGKVFDVVKFESDFEKVTIEEVTIDD